MNNKTFFHRHPVFIYFLLAFLISWVGSFLGGGLKFLRGEAMDFNDALSMEVAMLAGPFIAGILMTYLVDGRDGLRGLFARMKKWQAGIRWYLPLLIFPIMLLFVSLFLSLLISPELNPIFMVSGIVVGLLVGIMEETGWMGFAFPKMILKASILSASIYLGFIHGVWHLLAGFLGSFGTLGWYFLPYFIGFVVFVMALRVLIVWVYTNTESLLLSQLMHASSTGFFIVLIPTEIAPQNTAIFYIVYAIILCIVVVAVILKFGKTLKVSSNK